MTIRAARTCAIAGCLIGLTLALAGCLERKEVINVDPAGRVAIHAEFSSDSLDEIFAGDAAPSLRGGWILDQKVKRDDDGKETHTLMADAFFGAGAKLPGTYAAPSQVDADLFLAFPTTLTIERRANGAYYHFRRIYTRRPWAAIESLRKQVEKQLKDVSDKPKEAVTHEDRVLMVKALIEFELRKKLTFARAAFQEAAPTAPQDSWLALRSALLAMLDELDYERLARLIETPEKDPEKAEAIEGEAKAFDAAVIDRMQTTLRSARGFGGGAIAVFQQRYDWHQRYHEITEDLADDRFEITVQMPGEIVGSNADQAGGDSVSWHFTGEAVRDTDFELMVTSRVLGKN